MSSLPNSALEDDDVSASGIPHDLNSSIIVKCEFILNNLASVDCNDYKSIVENAWEDDTAGQSDHQGLTLDDSNINKHERLMKAKYQKVPLRQTASPHHEHATCWLPFLPTTRVKSVPLPVIYSRQQHTLNKGIKNASLDSYQLISVPRLRSDSPINLHRKKATKRHEHVIAGEHNSGQSQLLKLQSEIIPHRFNHGYYMSGKAMTLKDRYAVPEKELQKLRKLSLADNTALYYGKGMSQKKAVKSRHKQLVANKTDGTQTADSGTQYSSSSQDRADNTDDLSASITKTAMAVSKKRRIPITLTTTGGPLKTSMANLKTTDLNMLDDIADEDLIEIYRKKFEELDIDGSGSITLDELRASLFGAASEADVQFIMSLFDLDNSNSIELEEFIAVASLNDKILGKKRTADEPLQLDLAQLSQHLRQYKELFELFDSDGNGEISVEELMILLSAAMGIDEVSNTEFTNSILREIDKDENGTIDFHEFLRFIPFFLGIHDRILAEKLSIQELHNAKVKVHEHLRK